MSVPYRETPSLPAQGVSVHEIKLLLELMHERMGRMEKIVEPLGERMDRMEKMMALLHERLDKRKKSPEPDSELHKLDFDEVEPPNAE